ncbi:MAG: acyl--CoA ligase [Alphaproteobacteria bacterium]|nr:acyl--CoA ligase [Alphaproteobacteria bacterium]
MTALTAGGHHALIQSKNFGDLFRSRAATPGDALVEPLGGRIVTYSALDAACDGFARGLSRARLGPDARVAILALNRWEYVAALFGAMRAGVVPVPINTKLPAATIAYICEDAGVRCAFVDSAHADRVPAGIQSIDFDADWSAFLDGGTFASADVQARDVALQIYTSGTTGRPKGVLLGHEGQIWNAESLARSRRLGRDATMLIAAPLYHKNALVAVKIALAAGGRAVLLPRFDARAYIEAIGRYRVTSLSGVPTMYQLVLAERELLARTDVSSVRSISVGSAPASTALLESLSLTFPAAAVAGNYGLTEGGPVPFGTHPDGISRPHGSIGFPLADVECRLVGGSGPDEGVLHVRNPGVMQGYHNRPDETAKRLVNGWLDTQDVMRRDAAGFYYFIGRADDMFKCGGESIFPAEVEALVERHGDVLQAAVVPVADALKGQVPVAFVVRQPGGAVDEASLKQFALAHGPAYQHPRRIIFLDAMPLAGTNKIDRAALRALADAAMQARPLERRA